MESASSRPDAGNGLRCGFCPSLRAPYTCPRCLLRFCSVPCYHNHGSCARDFRDRELRLRLQGLRGDEASRGRLREALWRLRDLREPGDEQAGVGLGLEEEQLWEALTPEEQKAFRKLLSSGGGASLVPLWTPWWEADLPCGLIQEVDPRNPSKAGEGDLTGERDPQKPLEDPSSALIEERDPQNPLRGALVEERDPPKPFGEETDPQDPLRGVFVEETDLPKPFGEERDPQNPLRGVSVEGKDPLKPFGEETDLQNPLQGPFAEERDPPKQFGEERDPQNPLRGVFVEETDLPKPFSEETDLQNPLQGVLVEEKDPPKPLRGDLVEEVDLPNPLEAEERGFLDERGLRNPLRGVFVEEKDAPKPFVEERDPPKPLRGDLIEEVDLPNRVFLEERGLRDPLQGEEGPPKRPAEPPCEREASRLLGSIPPAIPPLSSFRTAVSPSAGFQLPGVLYGYVYSLSLYNGDVEEEEEEDVLLEFCETLLDVSPCLGSPQRVYGSASEALQDALRSVADLRYPECPLGRDGALTAVARLLSQKAFLLAALCHLCKLLRKGRKRMADSDRSKAFRAGKKCAFLLSWANENEGQLLLLALAVREEGRGQREAGQEVGALRRGLERKWRGKRPPTEKEKALIEELD